MKFSTVQQVICGLQASLKYSIVVLASVIAGYSGTIRRLAGTVGTPLGNISSSLVR